MSRWSKRTPRFSAGIIEARPTSAAQRSSRPAGRSAQPAGFTLIELVIAIGILGLIVATAYSSLTKLIQSKNVLDHQREATMIANAVLSRMTRELQLITADTNLLPPRDDLENGGFAREVHLIGESRVMDEGRRGDQITFVALEAGQYIPDGLTHAGIVQITYRVELDPEAGPGAGDAGPVPYYLVRDETPVMQGKEDPYKDTMTFPITKNIISLSFKYYDSDSDQWASEWPKEKRRLPSLISFSVRLKAGDNIIRTYATTIPVGAEQSEY